VLVVSTLTVMGCLGYARFGYTLILPSMQAALELSNTQTGALATANFVGYVIMAVLAGFVASRYGPRRVVAVSMLVVGLTMIGTGFVNGFWSALTWRVLTGVGSGGANVPVMALLPAWFAARRRGLAGGIAVSGSSLALIVTGWVVPRILATVGGEGWRYAWYLLGAAVLALGALGWALLRDRPEEKGLQPIGLAPIGLAPIGLAPIGLAPTGAAASTPAAVEARTERSRPSLLQGWKQVSRTRAIWHLALVYVAFGFSYVIYATFFARYLQVEAGYTADAAGNLWAVVGWISVLCGLIWGSVSDAIGRQYGLALVYLLQALSFALFALWPSPAGHWASTVLFGLTAWSIPGIVSAACGDCVGARLAPAAFGFVTLFFGLGQAAGPSVAGLLADETGSFGPAFLLAAGVALMGGIGSLLLRPQCELPVEG
jgi:sugar phosphate permease